VRRLYLLLIGLGILVFLAISTLLARVFSTDGAERSAITGLVQAEASGSSPGMLSRLEGCGENAACRAQVVQLSRTLRRSGSVSILQLAPSTGFSLTGTTGVARVAWNVSSQPRPVVQCVRVRRSGDAIRGLRVQLLRISGRIASDGDCSSDAEP
jgi:hypothetical protein